ncbi:uncharacterized protein CBL_20472 [Carabus blaptoides fortunei]
MLSEILDNEDLDAGIRFSSLQVLLNSRVKILTTGVFPRCYYERILEVIAIKGTGLTHLDLRGVWAKEYPELISYILQNLNGLKVLHIPHMADDTVLEHIANCRNLKTVNISGECNFTTTGLSKFSTMLAANKTNLKIIDIGSFGAEIVPHESIAELIEKNPQLLSLSSYSFVGKALLHIYRKNKGFKCDMLYVHDTRTTPAICDAVYHTCPKLENLYFDSPAMDVVENIENFRTLRYLKLNAFQCSEFHNLISSWGNNLDTIKLCIGHGILDMSMIATACSNLTTLELYKLEFVMHTTEHTFDQLEEVEILYSELTLPCLKYILRRSPELRKFEVHEPVKLSDGDLCKLFRDYFMLNLEELYFANARYLTVNGVELLMGHCPQLRVLGQISGWDLSTDDLDYLRAIVQSTNSNLTFVVRGIL